MTRLVQRLGLTRYEADEHYKQALQLYAEKNLNAALIEMGYAIELLPTNAEYYAARGFFYLEDGLSKEAATDFEESLKLYPYEMLAHYGLGMIAYSAKQWEEALSHFTSAYRVDPDRAETLYYLALTVHRQQKNAEALEFMRRAEVAYEKRNDNKTKRNAARWAKEFEKLAKQQAK